MEVDLCMDIFVSYYNPHL